jgi:hypothetical protein
MEDRALGESSATLSSSPTASIRREGRNVWIVTAYGISGLALFGILVYYFSTYVAN